MTKLGLDYNWSPPHLTTASKSDQFFMIHLTKLGFPMWLFGKESVC